MIFSMFVYVVYLFVTCIYHQHGFEPYQIAFNSKLHKQHSFNSNVIVENSENTKNKQILSIKILFFGQ